MTHLERTRKCWQEVSDFRMGVSVPVVRGDGLALSALVAVARYQITPQLTDDEAVKECVESGAAFVVMKIQEPGVSMYGANAGVGASGFVTRTTGPEALQKAILRGMISGVVPLSLADGFDPSFHESTLMLPESWVKGAMLLRINSLLRGHSGCRWILIDKLHQLLLRNIVPCCPLRQSISASGDLAPLGYIAASLTSDIPVQVWSGKGANRKRISSIQALQENGIETHSYGPKEVLSVINGTGPSCAVGALALHDSCVLALASQVLTAMTVEALIGSPETFDAFISEVARPHPGQIEVSRNGRVLLNGSKLAKYHDESDPVQRLPQDRYGLRTAPQWIGPHLEELVHAQDTIEIEMNSTTDNPIIDLERGRPVVGGNFQGTSIALVMETTRIGLQHLGRLAYAQFVELGNPSMNRGLPPDLAAWEPSLDFGTKAVDVATASYVSELSFVSNTVTNHVQSAEMHNQAVNSLALISARYTFTAIQLLRMVYANQLYAVCQALDLRAMITSFLVRMESDISASLQKSIGVPLPDDVLANLLKKVLGQARVSFGKTSHLDTSTRFIEVVRPLVADVIDFLANNKSIPPHPFLASEWQTTLATTLANSYRETRTSYFKSGSAADLMGNTAHVYRFVRETLGVAMRKGADLDSEGIDVQVSRIYHAFESGIIINPILAAMT